MGADWARTSLALGEEAGTGGGVLWISSGRKLMLNEIYYTPGSY